MIRIGLDMMGGDFAPLEAVKGAELFFADKKDDIHLVMIGDKDKISQHLSGHNIPDNAYSIVHAPEIIEMHEHPTKALKEKKESSIAVGFRLLAEGKTTGAGCRSTRTGCGFRPDAVDAREPRCPLAEQLGARIAPSRGYACVIPT